MARSSSEDYSYSKMPSPSNPSDPSSSTLLQNNSSHTRRTQNNSSTSKRTADINENGRDGSSSQVLKSVLTDREKSTASNRTDAVLRLRWNHLGTSKVIDQRSVDDVSQLTKSSRMSTVTPEQVPFPLTASETLSLVLHNRLDSVTQSVRSKVTSVLESRPISPVRQAYQWLVAGLRPDECFRDDYDGSLPSSVTTYFSYWLTIVHAMVFITSMSVFGLTSIGFGVWEQKVLVKVPNLKSEVKSYYELKNPWLGVSQESLILLGARYPLCMRGSPPESKEKILELECELETACCTKLDVSSCFQSSKDDCSKLMNYQWWKWSKTSPGPKRRIHGSVCGQDPRYCQGYKDDFSYSWPEKITDWPVCEEVDPQVSILKGTRPPAHMRCQLASHPCCYGLRTQCLMTTWEHCDLLRGIYNPDKVLCAQVSCLTELCGMHQDGPHQWYRCFTSLFIHDGMLTFLLSLWFQIQVMAKLEDFIGARIIFLFFVCGIFGNISAGLLAPSWVGTGPGGVHCGVLACLQVLFYLKPPKKKKTITLLLPSTFIQVVVVVLGFFPWVDFYNNLFGTIYGYLFSILVLIPKTRVLYHVNKSNKIVMAHVAVILAILVTTMTIFFFGISGLVEPVYIDETLFDYLECMPLTDNMCSHLDTMTGYAVTTNDSCRSAMSPGHDHGQGIIVN